jgi:2-oxoglutarate ferredoxin oxidoreductase subunit beta
MDNRVYGMTKGQPSPTTEADWTSKLMPQGTGLGELKPMAVALAAGANFIARGFTGDPNGLAELMVTAVRHPGFSFLEVLSPCVTFRPEQREWKKMVRNGALAPTTEPVAAATRIFADDGMNLGVLYAGGRRPFAPPVGRAIGTPADLERRFAL